VVAPPPQPNRVVTDNAAVIRVIFDACLVIAFSLAINVLLSVSLSVLTTAAMAFVFFESAYKIERSIFGSAYILLTLSERNEKINHLFNFLTLKSFINYHIDNIYRSRSGHNTTAFDARFLIFKIVYL
jgi:hypothetical protein